MTTATTTTTTMYLLTGDIGGTNSRMSLYGTRENDDDLNTALLIEHTFRNALQIPVEERADPAAFSMYIVAAFLRDCWSSDKSILLAPLEESTIIACLATAGLVLNNAVRLTNLDNILIDGTAMEQDRDDPHLSRIVRCAIINDFVAQGYGCLTLKPSEVSALAGPCTADQVPDQLPIGPKVCVGAGTGLGECYLTPTSISSTSPDYLCFPSEGGHVEYAPRNPLELALWEYLSAKFASKHRISVERVVSGKGLANVYEFLAHHYPDRIDEVVHAEFLQANDEQGRVVGENADIPGSLCDEAAKILMSAYGCEVGSAAIKWIPVGGLFVTGGLTPKNLPRIVDPDGDFLSSYRNKGRVSPVLEKIPLFAVLVENLGVRGAHQAAKMEFARYTQQQSRM